jgi:CMP-N-acetylneuraminic acid synthetase
MALVIPATSKILAYGVRDNSQLPTLKNNGAMGNGENHLEEHLLKVCLCGFSLYHLLLLARIVHSIVPGLRKHFQTEQGAPQKGLASLYPELSFHRILNASPYGVSLRIPLDQTEHPVRSINNATDKHPLLIYNEVIYSYTPNILKHFDKIVFLRRDLPDAIAADALATFHTRGVLDDASAKKSYYQSKVPAAIMRWNAQVRGFAHLSERMRIYWINFEDLVTDCEGEIHRLAAYLGTPLQGQPKLSDFIANSRLPAGFEDQGLARRVLPRKVLRTIKQECPRPSSREGNKASAGILPETPQPAPMHWSHANHLWTMTHAQNRNVVVHIPARSGSTRLKDKNIAPLGDLPLMAWTIRLAKQLPGVHRVIVNTDSPRYAEIARQHGAESPFLRPKKISGTKAGLNDAEDYLAHYLTREENYHFGKIITLYPTSPFRDPARISRMIELLDDYPIVFSCLSVRPKWDNLFVADGRNCLRLSESLIKASPYAYHYKPLGYFIGRSFVSNRQGAYLWPIDDPVELIDIDEPGDLELARYVLANGLYGEGSHAGCLAASS